MAKEPNTNPGSNEGEKPAPSESKAASASAASSNQTGAAAKPVRKATKTAARKPAAKRKADTKSATNPAAIEDAYFKFNADMQRISGESAEAYQKLLDKIEAEVEKLKKDVAASNPTKAFVQELTDAANSGDVNAISDAYTTLYNHTLQRQAAAEKRLTDIVTSYYENVTKLIEGAQKDLLGEAKGYADEIASTLAARKVSELKPTDQTVAAHAMLVGAVVQSMEKQ